MRYRRGQFPGSVISKHGDCPARSPDLTECDFFLWEYLKHKVWNVPLHYQPNNLRQLREAIVTEFSYMNQQTIQRSRDAMATQARLCIRAGAFPDE